VTFRQHLEKTMTTTIRSILVTVLYFAAAISSSRAEGRRFIVGVSHSLLQVERDVAWDAVLSFIVLQMRTGDTLAVYDASALQPVAELSIPSESLFASAKPRLTRLAAPLGKLKAFFAAGADMHLPSDGTLLVPQFLDFTARQLRRGNEELSVILVGAPFYHDTEMAFDFGPDGAYPGDGFLGLSANESPFSTVGKAQTLKGIAVHWTFLNESRWGNDAHRQGVLRFWSLFIQAQAGVLASAAGDAKAVFQRAADGVATPLDNPAIDSDAKAEMIIPRHRREGPQEAVRATTSATSPENTLSTVPNWLEDATVAKPKAAAPRHARVKIGLRWGDSDVQARAIDLDLYVRSNPGAKEISYRRTRTPEGLLWKDWLVSPAVSNGFETVELNGETDLTQLRVAVNFYRGHHTAGSVSATVRIWVNGDVFEAPIRIPASDGNRGEAADDYRRDPHWVVIDVPALVGLSR
jgi:hypothetical protein